MSLPLPPMLRRHHKIDWVYAGLVKALAEYVREHRSELPLMLWRDNSPQHFDIQNGEFPHPSVAGKLIKSRKCVPMKVSEGTCHVWRAAC